jgi:hypothetical protein
MKSAARSSSLFYSAYPLKVLEKAAAEQEHPHLKALLSSPAKPAKRFRVSPMVNPYPKQLDIAAIRLAPQRLIEPEGGEWFNHYE